jgi:hypothetical protein
MAALIERDVNDFATAALEDRRRKERPVTFREVAAAWLEWLAEVTGAQRWQAASPPARNVVPLVAWDARPTRACR